MKEQTPLALSKTLQDQTVQGKSSIHFPPTMSISCRPIFASLKFWKPTVPLDPFSSFLVQPLHLPSDSSLAITCLTPTLIYLFGAPSLSSSQITADAEFPFLCDYFSPPDPCVHCFQPGPALVLPRGNFHISL